MRRAVPIFLLLAASALAEEKNAAPAEDPIAGAKRDFESVKSQRGASETGKASLPTFAAPELSLGTTTPKSSKQKKTPAELLAEKKSANWLVDAMMKKDAKDANGAKSETDEADLLEPKLNPDGSERSLLQKLDDAEAKAKTPAKTETPKTGPEFNPLTRYMSGWMTPQDYSLLKPGMGGPSADATIARGESSLTGPTGDVGAVADKGGALDLMALSRSAPPATSAAAGNPYLQGFTPPPQNAASFVAPAAASAAAAPPTNVFAPPSEPPPTKSRLPDFAKPATDEKYFKQLKRF